MNIRDELKELKEKEISIRNKLKALVNSLPENLPGGTRLGHNCVAVSISTVHAHGGILSPRYYLGQPTKKMLVRIIERTSLTNINATFDKIIATGLIRDKNTIEKINPATIKALKEALEVPSCV